MKIQDTSSPSVLVVDDDEKTLRLVSLYLQNDGYRVLAATRGDEALQKARTLLPELVILDLMIPGLDGLEVCRTLRNESNPLVIMLTARTTEADKIVGLDAGADDYVAKPFSPRELTARVRAVLRRSVPAAGSGAAGTTAKLLCVGELCLDRAGRRALVGDQPVFLTPIEFRLLNILLGAPGRVYSREELIERALGYDYEGIDRTIDAHIKNLRRKIEPDRAHPRFIRTVFGVGYLCAPEKAP